MKVAAYNPETSNLEKTYVSTYQQKGSTSLRVKNNNNFKQDSVILIGRMGDERAEIVLCSDVSTDKLNLTISATNFDHNPDDPVYVLQWNQIRFFRATSMNDPFVLQETMPIDVDNADKVTRWDDTTAFPSYFYKTAFYNSLTSEISELSDPVAATGYNQDMIGSVIDGVVRRVRDTGFNVLTIDEYLDIADEVGADLISQAHKPYRFLKRTKIIDTVAGQPWVPLPTNIWKFRKVYVANSGGNYTDYKEYTPITADLFYEKYDNNINPPQDGVRVIAVDEELNRLLIYPTPKTAQTSVFKVRFYKSFDLLRDVASVVETPNTLIYRYKMLAEYYSAKAETDRQWLQLATKYENKYGNEIMKMQRTNRLDTGTPRSLVSSSYRRRRRYTLR